MFGRALGIYFETSGVTGCPVTWAELLEVSLLIILRAVPSFGAVLGAILEGLKSCRLTDKPQITIYVRFHPYLRASVESTGVLLGMLLSCDAYLPFRRMRTLCADNPQCSATTLGTG